MTASKSSLCLILLACAFSIPATAQKYPERNVRLIAAFPTGAAQILGLLVAAKLGEALVQPD